MKDLVIKNGLVIDGTVALPFNQNLAVASGKIQYLDDACNISSAKTWDASGKVVCPGFIDIHSHSDFPIYVDGLAQSGIRQGLTTLVTGNCGHGPAPAPDSELT